MTFFQDVYDRIQHATNAKTQTELAAVLEIRQSSISDAKRRDSVPSDWYMKLFEKFGLNPDWLKNGSGPMYLKINEVYGPKDAAPEGFAEKPAHYADPTAICKLAPVYSMSCPYTEGQPVNFRRAGRIALPQSHVTAAHQVFQVSSDAFDPLIVRGAYVGVDTESKHPVSGDIYAVLMPHEGVVLKRLFLSTEKKCFLLRTEQKGYPDEILDAAHCEDRIVGRVNWVFQTV